MKTIFPITLALLSGVSLSAQAYELQYAGSYQVIASHISCYRGPGHNYELKTSYQLGHSINSSYVAFNQGNEAWLFTEQNCFVRGVSQQLQYQGYGEDPSTMCDRRKETC